MKRFTILLLTVCLVLAMGSLLVLCLGLTKGWWSSLTIEQDEDGLQMTAYTGRSLVFSWFRCRIALWLLERRLPAGSADTGKRRNPDGERAEKKAPKREAPKRAEPKREEPKRKEPKRIELKKTEPKQKETAKRLATGTASAKKAAPKRLRK